MIRMTVTEANQNFSKVTRAVSEDGIVIIEKNGAEAYVVMSVDEYKRIKGDVFWGVEENGTVTKFETSGSYVHLYSLKPLGDDVFRYSRLRLPSDVLKVDYVGNDIHIDFNRALVKAMDKADVALSLISNDVDISHNRIAKLDRRKDKIELGLVVEVQALREEYERDVAERPSGVHNMENVGAIAEIVA